MNDLLRLLKRGLRPFGYDIRYRDTYNLCPCKGIPPVPELDCARRYFDYDGGDERKATANLDNLKIVYRTCLTEARQKKGGRIGNMSASETAERCFASLVQSVNAALQEKDAPRIEVLILDDHSEPELLKKMTDIAASLKCPWRVKTTEKTGQGESLYEQFALARNDDALYYFCEDDYLHEPRAVYELAAFYRQIYAATRRHLVLYPQEHASLYARFFYPSYLVLSPYRHWRTACDATHQLFMHAHVVRDYWKYFENTKYVGDRKNRRKGSEKKTTNRLFRHLPCFSPIPSLAGHMQSLEDLPPFFEWRKLWSGSF